MDETCTLYKYMKVNEHLIDALKNSRLYLSDGSNFNDPFELYMYDSRKQKPTYIKGLKIACFTNGFRKKLMWSFYGDSHNGVCLTVVLPRRLVYPVCYTTKRLKDCKDVDVILSKNLGKVDKKFVKPYDMSNKKKIAFIKDSKWKDEKEYRVVLDDEDASEFVVERKDKMEKFYLPVKITKIYIGVNFEKNLYTKEKIFIQKKKLYKEVLNICKAKKIKINYMQMSNSKYELLVKKENKNQSKEKLNG